MFATFVSAGAPAVARRSRRCDRGLLTALLLTVLLCVGWLVGASAAWAQDGAIGGRITTLAPASAEPLTVTTNQDVCGETVPDESVLVGPDGGLANAVITVVGLAPVVEASPIEVTNDGCRFVPRVQVSRPGAQVDLTSADDVLHTSHAYAEDGRSLFNVAIPMAGLTITRVLTARGVVRLVCDTHTWMRGFVVAAVDRAVVSAADGSFRINGVPPGTYELRFWHERLEAGTQTVTVTAGGVVEVTVEMTEP